jgi:hypothetical protein
MKRMPKLRSHALTSLTLAAALLAAAAPLAGAGVVTDWNAELLDAVRAERTNPPRATRAMAMMNVSMFDAVNGIADLYEPYAVAPGAPAGASAEAAAAAAAHAVLSVVYPGRQAELDARLAGSLAAVPDGTAEDDGVAWGEEVAAQILALRADDGADTVLPYQAPEGAGWWVRTGPGFVAALLPNWGYVNPWSIPGGSFVRQPAPPPLTSDEYTVAFDEVYRLGNVGSTERTADQSQIAEFWDDGVGTNTPPGHWNLILQGLAEEQGLSLVDTARLFALHGMSVADAAIAAWDTKFHWDHWRPVTGIELADTDGNPDTHPEAGWTSFITNPPFPAYTSGHSTFSSSSARIAALVFGRDDLAFTAPSDGTPGVTRSYDGLWQAAQEAGQSRIYGGIHWQHDNQGGLKSGRAIAEHVFFHELRPLADNVAACDPGAGHLCLGDDRFAVRATWTTPNGASGAATPVELPSGGGYFWFFNPGNPELTVKVLDGCAAFGHYWVFASGLTNVEVELRVTDTEAGVTRTYYSPAGSTFAPIQDTAAFATCP